VQNSTLSCFGSFASRLFHIGQTAELVNGYIHRVAHRLCSFLDTIKTWILDLLWVAAGSIERFLSG
jgi:hypothetical protein